MASIKNLFKRKKKYPGKDQDRKKSPESFSRSQQDYLDKDRAKFSLPKADDHQPKRKGSQLLKERIRAERFKEGPPDSEGYPHRLSRSQVTQRAWDKMTWNPPVDPNERSYSERMKGVVGTNDEVGIPATQNRPKESSPGATDKDYPEYQMKRTKTKISKRKKK